MSANRTFKLRKPAPISPQRNPRYNLSAGLERQLDEYRGRVIGRVVQNTERRRSRSSRSSSSARTAIHKPEEGTMAANNATLSSMDIGMAGNNRSGASTPNSVSAGHTNGGGSGANYMSSLPAGHQQDLNYLFEKIQDLSKLLASNREKVRELTKKAEEAGKRAMTNGTHPEGETESSVQTDQGRIRELERELKKRDYIIDLYKHEQKENTSLIGDYEDAVGTMTEQIRNYCLGIDKRFLDQKKHYNNLLQQEKDDHLNSRLEKDQYFNRVLQLSGQIRHAFKLRTDEWCDEYRVVAALQTQVRCLRRVAGWDKEKPEEEAGWEYLKDCPLNDTGV